MFVSVPGNASVTVASLHAVSHGDDVVVTTTVGLFLVASEGAAELSSQLGGAVRQVTVDPAGRAVAVLSNDGRLELWSLADRTVTARFDDVRSAPFVGDGTLLVEGPGWVRIVAANSGEVVSSLDVSVERTIVALDGEVVINESGALTGVVVLALDGPGGVELLDWAPAAGPNAAGPGIGLQGLPDDVEVLGLERSPAGTTVLAFGSVSDPVDRVPRVVPGGIHGGGMEFRRRRCRAVRQVVRARRW